jgi:hypothetical protein
VSYIVAYEDDLCYQYNSYFFEEEYARNWINNQKDLRWWKLYQEDENILLIDSWEAEE